MKKILLMVIAFAIALFTFQSTSAQSRKGYKPKTVHVKSYRTKSGKQVRSHYRSKPSKRRTASVNFDMYFERKKQLA